MSVLAPRDAVYALARTQLDWIPTPRSTLASPDGFAHEQRFMSCPDCLTNGAPMFGCETCGGRGEIPDSGRDPYENRNQAFFGDDNQRRRDRARMVDAQIIRLKQLAAARDNDPDALPEDWLSRAVRLKAQQWRRGDYALLEQAQDLLAVQLPMRHLGWVSFVVEQQPLSLETAAKVRLDDTAGWLADRIVSAIAARNAYLEVAAQQLGIRARLRPAHIVIPDEHLREHAEAQAGKGRWANGHAQGQRNALVVAMAAEGKTAGEIARRVGLTKRRVEQLLAGVNVATASGPAA